MRIIYENGAITAVDVADTRLQSKTTPQERMTWWGISLPNTIVLEKLDLLERQTITGEDNYAVLVATMLSEGLIDQTRADELLA